MRKLKNAQLDTSLSSVRPSPGGSPGASVMENQQIQLSNLRQDLSEQADSAEALILQMRQASRNQLAELKSGLESNMEEASDHLEVINSFTIESSWSELRRDRCWLGLSRPRTKQGLF